jgi:hypothetical protein
MSKQSFAKAFDRLVNRKNSDGSLKYSAKDVHGLRAALLLEIARRDEVDQLSDASKVELALVLENIGITGVTAPEQVRALTEKFFKNLAIDNDLLLEFGKMLGMLQKGKDRVEAVADTSKAYDKMMEKEAEKAPKADDPVAEGAEPAQTFTLNIGGKVRI